MKPEKNSSIISILKNPTSLMVMLGFSFLSFDLQYLIMSKLPGSRDEMCVMGAGLNASNIIFAIAISIMGGLFVAGFLKTLSMRHASYSALSLSGVGAVVGALTVFCTACTIPVISVLGLAVGLSFFTTYNIWFKSISLALMSFGLYQLDAQLKGDCERCVD